MAADEKFRAQLGVGLWNMACDIGRSPPEAAWGISHRYVEHLFAAALEWVGRLREAKCPSEWTKDDIEKHNAKCALASLEVAVKQRDDALAVNCKLSEANARLIGEKEDLRRGAAEAQAETLQVRTAWAHAVDERDKARRELEVARRDRNAYHAALDRIVKLADDIRYAADGFSTK